MGWLKTELPDKWHRKVKAYRDRNDVNMTTAACALLQRGIIAYEADNGTLEVEEDA